MTARSRGRTVRWLAACAAAAGAIVALAIWPPYHNVTRPLAWVVPAMIGVVALAGAVVVRLRARAEQAAWYRLALATEKLNQAELSEVMAVGIVNAARLFGAAEVEISLPAGPAGALLVRGDSAGVRWSGNPVRAPAIEPHAESITARLTGPGHGEDVGEIRLHFPHRVSLSERDRLSLRTFASALRGALRSASANSDVQRLAVRSAHAALHDQLTGLANWRRLREYGDELLAGPAPTAVVVIDLDRFREVNETLGYVAGDRVLVEVGRRLAAIARPGDLVARLGGDEFAVLTVGLTSATAVLERAQELLARLDDAVDLGATRVRIEACAGTAQSDATLALAASGGMVELIRRAEVAMTQAKRSARVVGYDPDGDTADVAALMLGGDLPRAIDNREFTVNFQPIVDLASGQMISAEALTRWQHPERGDLDPRRFLAAVERSGVLPDFAQAVLDQALAAMLRWRAAGVSAPVAVNASPRSLLDPTFPALVVDRLAAHGVTGADLVIELTESLTLGQVEQIGGVLAQLRRCGVRLALDDFGTGYSSMAILARVPADELKIDRSFVAALTTSPEATAVVRSNVELGRTLGLLVVAEGVERADQRSALWQLGCPAGQGHYFAKPMSIERLLDRIGDGDVAGRLCEPLATDLADLPHARRPDQARSP